MNELAAWILLLKLMSWKITVTHDFDHEQIRQDFIQMEIDTRAYRQKKSGHGL